MAAVQLRIHQYGDIYSVYYLDMTRTKPFLQMKRPTVMKPIQQYEDMIYTSYLLQQRIK